MNDNIDNKYLSVSALNKYLYYKFDNDLNLRNVYLKAEISNLRLSKGILYFVLKDNESEISALMFQTTLNKINFKLEDGMTVLVSGKVALYHKRGTYAITVNTIEAIGLGDAYLKFIQLKDKLMKEGLFNEEYKLPIKKFNHKIGLVTSSTGDAMHDVISTINKRYPLAEVILYPAIVQGTDAPKSLISAITKANQEAICDCIIIARGGGSLEDLSCFNDEELARCIFDSSIPTISGVGHEADFTICDFVASRRAPTPTGAAVIASPDMNDLIKEINLNNQNLVNSMKNKLINAYNKYQILANSYTLTSFNLKLEKINDNIDHLQKRLYNLSPIDKINNYLDKLNVLNKDLNNLYNLNIDNNIKDLDKMIDKLILLNPLNIMKKGYSITFKEGKVVYDIKDVSKDDEISTKLLNGEIRSKVIDIREDK